MKRYFTFPVFLLLVLKSGFGFCQEVPFPHFLAGTWQVEGRQAFEEWEIVGAGHLRGAGYQVKNGVRQDLEALELKYNSGVLTFTATVADQNEGRAIDFSLALCHDHAYTFENPRHDFPQKITYSLVFPDTLMVDVSGTRRAFTQKMVRVE